MRLTTKCVDKLVVKAMRRSANVSCAVSLDTTGYGNAKVSRVKVLREGQFGEDSAMVSFSEAQR